MYNSTMEDSVSTPVLCSAADTISGEPAVISGSTILPSIWAQGKLGKYAFNKYCPLDGEGGSRSVTGCVPLADAQIVYYWASLGYDISITLTDTDAYTSKGKNNIAISSSGSTVYDFPSFDTINGILAEITVGSDYNSDTDNDIAALCFACGVLAQASYGSSSTSASMSTDVYRRAGFDSYQLYTSYENSDFFVISGSGSDSTSNFSAVGWEILTDNLVNGCVVELGAEAIGHAFLLDGYNSTDGTYHLNFGWGNYIKRYSSEEGCYIGNGWYTPAEIDNFQVFGVLLDVYYDYNGYVFTVNSEASCGVGTLARVMAQLEALNTGGFMTFDHSLSDKTIVYEGSLPQLYYSLEIDRITGTTMLLSDYNLWGFYVGQSLTVNALDGVFAASTNDYKVYLFLANDEVLTVNNISGAAIVNAGMTGYTFYSNHQVNISVTGGGVFSGAYNVSGTTASIAAVADAIDDFGSFGYDAVSEYLSCATGYAVRSESGDDKISLTDCAVMMGTVSLAGGANTISIESGSLLYSCISASEHSLSLELILNDPCGDPMLILANSSTTSRSGWWPWSPTVTTTIYGIDMLCSALSGAVSVDVSDAAPGEYVLIGSISNSDLSSLVFSVSDKISGGVELSLSGTSASGRYSLAMNNDARLTLTIAPDDDAAPVLQVCTADGLSWSSVNGASDYLTAFSTDNFETSVYLAVSGTDLDTFCLPDGSYSCRVSVEGASVWSDAVSLDISGGAAQGAVLAESDADGIPDVFFARSSGVWSSGYAALHGGAVGLWDGTHEYAVILERNKFADLFAGSGDANILYLTDDANGDAIFLDDIYTGLPDSVAAMQARVAEIDEIRAGAGSDIIDLTSNSFSFTGGGIVIRGGSGDDVIWSNSGSNSLFGDDGNDRIVGCVGNDVIAGGSGSDSMYGGGGSDVFTFCENWGADTVGQSAGGSITLWFAEGMTEGDFLMEDADAGAKISLGENSVVIKGFDLSEISLLFGDDGSDQYDSLLAMGAFSPASSDSLAGTQDALANGILARV